MYCPNCATQIHDNVKFCTRCGSNLAAISDLLNGSIIETPQPEAMVKLLEKCHNGYLSTVIGLGLVILALLIIIAAMMVGVPSVAISSFIFLGWAIPAIAQGVGRWLSARKEMKAVFEDHPAMLGEEHSQKSFPSRGIKRDSMRFNGSVTEGTTASLDQRA